MSIRNPSSPPQPGNKRSRRRWEWLLLLLALLTSFVCVFCSTWLALQGWAEALTPATMLTDRQADYRGGPGDQVEFEVVDPRVANEAAADSVRLRLTPTGREDDTPIVIGLLPATPTSTPAPSPPPLVVPASPTPLSQNPPGQTPPPSAAATPTPATSPVVGSPTPAQLPPSPTPALLPTETPIPTPALPTPTSSPVAPTPTASPVVPTATATPVPLPTPTPADNGDNDNDNDDDPPVSNNPPLALADAITTNEDSAVTIPVLANDSDPDGYLVPASVMVIAGPANGSAAVNPATGEITYTPAANFNGSNNFTYRVCDNDGDCATATVTITVNPVNDAPLANDDTVTTNEDTPALITVLANDSEVDGEPLSVVSVTAPTAGALTLNPDNTLTYTSPPNFFGTVQATYTIADASGLTATAALIIIVNPVNDAPVAVDDAGFTAEDTTEDIYVLDNDSDLEGDSLVVVSVGAPTHGTATTDGVAVTYVPAPNFYGTDIFAYTISDGGLTATAWISMTVAAVNDPPVAQGDVYNTAPNTPLAIASPGILSNDADVDPGETLIAVGVTAPAHGTLVLTDDGSFMYTPDPGFTGTDTFTYQALDGLLAPSNIATVTITVSGP